MIICVKKKNEGSFWKNRLVVWKGSKHIVFFKNQLSWKGKKKQEFRKFSKIFVWLGETKWPIFGSEGERGKKSTVLQSSPPPQEIAYLFLLRDCVGFLKVQKRIPLWRPILLFHSKIYMKCIYLLALSHYIHLNSTRGLFRAKRSSS